MSRSRQRQSLNREDTIGLDYRNLDVTVREYMVEEIERDIAGRGLYLSNYLTEQGKESWSTFLRDAALHGSDDSLARSLDNAHCFKTHVERRKPKGGFTMAAVPYNAAQTLAESQFNMYFMRALARHASETQRYLLVYRAKSVENPRPDSERMIGSTLNPQTVLEVLRDTLGVEPPIGIPLPNSGLTVTFA